MLSGDELRIVFVLFRRMLARFVAVRSGAEVIASVQYYFSRGSTSSEDNLKLCTPVLLQLKLAHTSLILYWFTHLTLLALPRPIAELLE